MRILYASNQSHSLLTHGFVLKFPFPVKMLAINGMFEFSLYSRCENNQNSTKDTWREEEKDRRSFEMLHVPSKFIY